MGKVPARTHPTIFRSDSSLSAAIAFICKNKGVEGEGLGVKGGEEMNRLRFFLFNWISVVSSRWTRFVANACVNKEDGIQSSKK